VCFDLIFDFDENRKGRVWIVFWRQRFEGIRVFKGVRALDGY